ncbi:glycolate oxidase iron-sulfur subunit [Nitrosomonas sp. JL21]|uniref:glycolate oxidase subunit GlcF n=1 Tax=Nitrosomonas sp. JL21 TaxID=153949 RepID=UPI0013684070|nr:glycolate oxidase subunit GlcF [Nitrosomonas sp. JL21]MBL8497200.1 glycolate oxidase subunit GlcF [Nitrosomonas sp.]MXS76671.1 glycolate oxidase iron-sulfur subunit [Nitrosomonas sp. JL21]
MQTKLADFIKNSPEGKEADAILRSCVHCGFCLATCPTYQILGDELDSPRGRIYLMKQMLEGQPVTRKTQLHLDRCLTCRACETTCPSGVRYGALVDISRGIVEKQVKRTLKAEVLRYSLRKILPNKFIFNGLLKIGRMGRWLAPGSLKKAIPAQPESAGEWPLACHARAMLVLDGCVQPTLAPNINAATARVLDKLGISLIKAEKAGCCGAVTFHLNAQQEGLDYMRRNIDAWWPFIEQHKAEAIVVTASGCGVTVKDYGHLLQHDEKYAGKAARISALAKDVSEILYAELADIQQRVDRQNTRIERRKLSFHSPCTLQHGMQIRGVVEKILTTVGFDLTHVPNTHLCCGSAGTYSILQPQLSQQLLKNKITALESGQPDQIATANIGCLMHLQSGTLLSVKHWVELVDERLS